MAAHPFRCLVGALVLVGAAALFLLNAAAEPAGSPKADAFAAQFRKFAEQHCVSCHGPTKQKGRLRLDTLPVTLADKDVAACWEKVLDRLSRGEMPPKGEDRPPEKEAQAVVAGPKQQLRDASFARQQREGRVVLRRLNRTEYETTLRDLLGTSVAVKDLLPDDNVAAGFDNVSAVLDVSSAHLLRYQEAAEKALRTVIPTRPFVEYKERRTGRQITEKMPTFRDVMDKVVRLDGDTLILYVRPYDHVPCATPPVAQTGRYRVRASVYAVGTEGKPLPMLCAWRDQYGPQDNQACIVRDVPAGKPAVIEGEFDLKQRQVVVFTGWSLPALRELGQLTKGKPLAQYTGRASPSVFLENTRMPVAIFVACYKN